VKITNRKTNTSSDIIHPWPPHREHKGVINYVTGPTRIFPHDRYKPLRIVGGGFILIIISYSYSAALKTSVVRNLEQRWDKGKSILRTVKNNG